MIELNSIFVVLLVEGLVCLVLLVIGGWLFFNKKNSGEQVAVHELIDKLEDTGNFKAKKQDEMVSKYCVKESDELKQLLSDITENEHVLYQQIIKMFVDRDVDLLQAIDQPIDKLSEPYYKIIRYVSENAAATEQQALSDNDLHRLKQENEKLGVQLKEAMHTIEEITAEYSKVFSGTQTELELENSSKKMFGIFKNAEHQVRASYKDLKAE